MTFNRLMKITSLVTLIFASYLIAYGGYALWELHLLQLPEAFERDAHGMSRVVGYSFIVMVGTIVLGIGLVAWLVRSTREEASRKAITVGFLSLNSLTLIVSFIIERFYWRTNWGKLYVLVFSILTVAFIYRLLVARRVESGSAV